MEKNPEGYLSAAEMPLSRLYICMAGVFFSAALLWVYILMKHRYIWATSTRTRQCECPLIAYMKSFCSVNTFMYLLFVFLLRPDDRFR